MDHTQTVLMPGPITLGDLARKLDTTPNEAAYLYRKADRMLKTWHPSVAAGDSVPLSPATFQLASRISDYVQQAYPSRSWAGSEIFQVVGVFRERMEHQYDTETDAGFAQAVEDSLEVAGLLETEGDCPICRKSGDISAPRHHVCARLIVARARCKCDCGQPAHNTYGWRPMCDTCFDHQHHLDALYD